MIPFKHTFRITPSMADKLDAFILRSWEFRQVEVTRSEIVRKAVKQEIRLPTQEVFLHESANEPDTDPPANERLEIDVKIVISSPFDSPLVEWIQTHTHAQLRTVVQAWLDEHFTKVQPPPPPKPSTLAEMAYLASQRNAFNQLCLSLKVNPNCLEEGHEM